MCRVDIHGAGLRVLGLHLQPWGLLRKTVVTGVSEEAELSCGVLKVYQPLT